MSGNQGSSPVEFDIDRRKLVKWGAFATGVTLVGGGTLVAQTLLDESGKDASTEFLESALRRKFYLDRNKIRMAFALGVEHPEAKKLLEFVIPGKGIYLGIHDFIRVAFALGPGNSKAKKVLEDVLMWPPEPP